jgi:hypothetical protein
VQPDDEARIPARVLSLSTSATDRNPLGLRVAVLEHAAMLREAGLPWGEADARAWDLEVNDGQRGLFG